MTITSEQLACLIYELLDAHDDTARIAAGMVLDARWQAHLQYLRDLQRVGRELLAKAANADGTVMFPHTLVPAVDQSNASFT